MKQSTVTLKGSPMKLTGSLPKVGDDLIDATLIKTDLTKVSLRDFLGRKLILNIFPSLDTGVCAASVKQFNERAAAIPNVEVLCISRDLPFAADRFCTAEGIENVSVLSDYANWSFGKNYGLEIITDPLVNLLARAVIVIDENGKVVYTELVPEITQEPDYDQAISIIK